MAGWSFLLCSLDAECRPFETERRAWFGSDLNATNTTNSDNDTDLVNASRLEDGQAVNLDLDLDLSVMDGLERLLEYNLEAGNMSSLDVNLTAAH